MKNYENADSRHTFPRRKWPANFLPDIENLKAIALLFDVSVDWLLDDGDTVSSAVVREATDLSQYEKTGAARSKADAAVRAKFPDARIIYPLVRKKKLSMAENIIDLIVQPGVLHAADSLTDTSSWYLVELEHRQLLVNVTREYIESRELSYRFDGNKLEVGNNIFKKFTYTV